MHRYLDPALFLRVAVPSYTTLPNTIESSYITGVMSRVNHVLFRRPRRRKEKPASAAEEILSSTALRIPSFDIFC